MQLIAAFGLSPGDFDFPFPEPTESGGAPVISTGNDVRDFRLRCDLSQTDFAKQIGVTVTTVSSWERKGKKPLPLTALDKILVGFGFAPPLATSLVSGHRERVERLQRQIDKIPPAQLDALEPIFLGLTREAIVKNDGVAN